MVHAVHAGIIQSPMLATTLTKFNLVTSNPLRRVFSFLVVDSFTQVFNLGGIRRDGGGNRYQSQLLILFLPSFNSVQRGLNHVPTLFHFVFHLFLGKSLINKVCSHVPPRKIGDRQGKLGKTW